MLVWILAQGVWICRVLYEWFDTLETLPSGYSPEQEAFLRKAEWENGWNWFYLSLIGLMMLLACIISTREICLCVCKLCFRKRVKKS